MVKGQKFPNVAGNPMFHPNPGTKEMAATAEMMGNLYKAGVRKILLSGPPGYRKMKVFKIANDVVIRPMIQSGKLEKSMGIKKTDSVWKYWDMQLPGIEAGYKNTCDDFNKNFPDARCVYHNETAAIERVRESVGPKYFDAKMWDWSMFHPTRWGHKKLAQEAFKTVTGGFPELAATVVKMHLPP